MKNTGLEEAQAGIKIVGRNTNNLRYIGDNNLRYAMKFKDTCSLEEKLWQT